MSGPAPSNRVFSPVTAILLVAVCAFALSAFVVLSAYAPDLQRDQGGGARAMSRSAIGFAGITNLLQDLHQPSRILRRPPPLGDGTASSDLLVLTPNPLQTTATLQAIPYNGPILIVLPKWLAVPDAMHGGWVRAAGLVEPDALQRIVEGYGGPTRFNRRASAARPVLSMDGEVFRPAAINNLQTLQGVGWTPVMTDETGAIVLARMGKSQIFVLSDPDLMNNHGLRDLETARTATAILEAVRPEDSGVMFDVTLSGFRDNSSLLRLIFDPPFLAVTLCLVAAAILLGLHAVARFGPSRRPERVFAFGGAALAENTATLIRMAGREPAMGPRYAALVRGFAARSLAAPKDLAPADLTAFLDRMSRQRGLADTLSSLTERAGLVRQRGELLTLAQRLHRWRLEMTREHQ